MSEIATGKLVIWMRLQAKRITPAGNRTSIMLSAAADRLEQQEQRIAELEQYLSRRVCYTKIDELERELAAEKSYSAKYEREANEWFGKYEDVGREPATYKQTFCPECHMPMGSDEKKCSECDVSWALEGEGEE